MRTLAIALVAAICVAGCEGGKNNQEDEKNGGYVDQLIKAKRQAREVGVVPAVQQCIQAYRNTHDGRNPKSLDELRKEFPTLPAPPKGKTFKYDPETGSVELVPAD